MMKEYRVKERQYNKIKLPILGVWQSADE